MGHVRKFIVIGTLKSRLTACEPRRKFVRSMRNRGRPKNSSQGQPSENHGSQSSAILDIAAIVVRNLRFATAFRQFRGTDEEWNSILGRQFHFRLQPIGFGIVYIVFSSHKNLVSAPAYCFS